MALQSMFMNKKFTVLLFLITCHKLHSFISENHRFMSAISAFAVSDDQGPNMADDIGSVGASASEVSSVPLLPESDPNDTTIPSIKLGETIRFEEMGPIIINSDGTTRRISNWDSLSKQEKEATWRRISKRNDVRRKMLLEQQIDIDTKTKTVNDDEKEL